MSAIDPALFLQPLSPAWAFQVARSHPEFQVALSGDDFGRLADVGLLLLDLVTVQVAIRVLEHGVGRAEVRFRLETEIEAVCGRCGVPMGLELEVERTLRLFDRAEDADKAESDRLEEWLETDEDDWDALSTEDHQTLIDVLEDEVLLAFSEPPVHDKCPEIPGASDGSVPAAGADDAALDRQRPFESLASLLGQKKAPDSRDSE